MALSVLGWGAARAFLEHPSWRHAITLGALCGLMVATDLASVWVALAWFGVIVAACHDRTHRRAVAGGVVAAAVVFAPFAPAFVLRRRSEVSWIPALGVHRFVSETTSALGGPAMIARSGEVVASRRIWLVERLEDLHRHTDTAARHWVDGHYPVVLSTWGASGVRLELRRP
jgi:hypothetical protein